MENLFTPHCGNKQVYRLANYRELKCGDKKNDNQKFTALVGAVFENTKVPLQNWFATIYLCTLCKYLM